MNRSLARIKQPVAVSLLVGVVATAPAHANGLNVPGDFPNSFAMNLLGGVMVLDNPNAISWAGKNLTETTFATDAKRILFSAGAFDGVGPGAGTSQLTLTSFNRWNIGTANVVGSTASFYIDGPGTGTLVDNADSTAGNWTLQVPLYATWNGQDFQFPDFTLSTAASYSYYASGYYPDGGSLTTVNGAAMDYATGDAYLVGQSSSGFANSPFAGLRLTVALHGNDPVVVPLPGALWLFGSGMLGLMGVGGWRRRYP